MKHVQLTFLKAGLQTTLQDEGRLGYQHLGIPVGGYADVASANSANWLVGNELNTPVLEIPIMGPEISIEGSCQIAITGGDMSASINDVAVKRYQTINIEDSALIKFGRLVSGCRAYLAVGGTWQVQEWLGSCSPLAGFSQLLTPGAVVQKGQKIILRKTRNIEKRVQEIPILDEATTYIKVYKGAEYEYFTQKACALFFEQVYTVGNRFDRMGCVLHTRQALPTLPGEIISSSLLPGTVQISNDGFPIIVLKDAPVTGGYNRIAIIDKAHQDLIAQMKQGDQIQFVLC